MLQTSILILATLSGSTTQNMTMINNVNNTVTHAKQEIRKMRNTFLESHKLNNALLLKDLNIIYNSENHLFSNLKDGRNDHKWHWYGVEELWINEEKGTQLNDIIADGKNVGDFIATIAFLTDGLTAPIALAIGTFLYAQWSITWREVNEGNGIHIEIECWGAPYIVYAHAQ